MIKNCLTIFACVFVLFLVSGCNRGPELLEDKSEVIKKSDQGASAILIENFAVGSIVKLLVKSSDVEVFEPVPQGVNPEEWLPSSEQIRQFNEAKPLIIVSGKPAPWTNLITKNSGIVNTLPRTHNNTSVATDPSRALSSLEVLEQKLVDWLPDEPIAERVSQLRDKLNYYQDEIAKIELPSPPKFPFYAETEPEQSGDLLVLFESRLKRLQDAAALAGESYENGVVPILEAYCIECHDEENDEGQLNFDLFLTEKAAAKNPKLWEKVSALVELGQMPPPKRKDRPTEKEMQALYKWSEQLNESWAKGDMGKDPGMTTVHRLNKNEYNYTIRDLFGLQLRPADDFPEESGGEAGFDNNADALFLPALLMENYIESGAGIVEAVYLNRQARERYLFARPDSAHTPTEAAKRVISRWSQLIYRKRANKEEFGRLVKLFETEYAAKKDYNGAMASPLYAMLISPNFLYRSTLAPVKDKPYPIDDFELASRLSYFIWSSMPDRELFSLAAKGQLKDPKVIEAQVKRMLVDEKSKVLGKHFAGQWFKWELLRTSANPDRKKFPEFDFQLRVSLYQESSEFFNHLVNNNLSAYQLIDSDYTFLNETLAKHYKIPGITGAQLRQVKLTDPNRGGVLGMGSVMTTTALPLRSSPAIRGAFVLSAILGTPPPDPPMDVEQLPEDDREIASQTFREALVQHREDANCKSCHQVIDPLGFGLEAFDAIGRFRTSQNGLPLDTNGEMPDGTTFSSPAELKKALMNQKDLFAKNLVKKLLSYALGRELSPFDRPTIDEITKKVMADDGRIQTAFVEVSRSYPMLNRRGDGYVPSPNKNQTTKKQ